MSMFFRYKGYLEFETAAEAHQYYDILTNNDECWYRFVPEELEIVSKKIRFKSDGNFNSYLSCEKTKDLISEAARHAVKGSVKVDEGDSEKSIWNRELIPASRKIDKRLRTYRFNGRLEFSSESIARFHCRRLLTNSERSAFTKFERVSIGDRRDIRFDANHLIIDCQYTIDERLFQKTEQLINDIRSNSTSGDISIKEVKAHKFVPKTVQNKAPGDWVNDMTRKVIFYRFTGSVLYHTPAEAEAARVKLLSDPKSVFSITGKSSFPVYVSKESRLVFDDINRCSRKMLNETDDLIREVIEFARTGKVVCSFSYVETMDTFVVDRLTPSRVRKWNKFVQKSSEKKLKA